MRTATVRRVGARLMPAYPTRPPVRPDYLARLKKIYIGKQLAVSGSELLARERERF